MPNIAIVSGSNGILQAESLAGPETLNGPLLLANQSAAPAAAATGQVYGLAGQPQWINPQGLTGAIPGCQGGLLTAGITTVANTSAETVLQTFSIPASDPAAGSVYQMVGWGVYSDTGTPNLSLGSRWGGISGTSLSTIAATALGSTVTSQSFKIDCMLNFLSATSAQVFMTLQLGTSTSTDATTTLTSTPSAAVTVSASTAKTWVTTVTFGAASSSNTISLLAGYTIRLA